MIVAHTSGSMLRAVSATVSVTPPGVVSGTFTTNVTTALAPGARSAITVGVIHDHPVWRLDVISVNESGALPRLCT